MSSAEKNDSSVPFVSPSATDAHLLASDAGLSDVELLRRFVAQIDQLAMTTIIARHGSMVMSVCRQGLRNEHDAADAFQATFLVLLKKAGSLGKFTSLAGWLYAVAHRVANKSKSRSSWRKKREGSGIAMAPIAPPNVPVDEETVGFIHAELRSLPEKYRLPLILCCLEGATREVAAEQLGWTLGSLKGRLERGREMLLVRLKKRGVVLSVAALAGVFVQQAAAEIPTVLVSSTVNSLALVAAGQTLTGAAVSAQTAALTQGVLKAMYVAKLKISGLVLLAAGIAATSSVVVLRQVPGEQQVQAPAEPNTNTNAPLKEKTVEGEKPADDEKVARLKLRRQSMRNMMTFGLGLHGYHSGRGTFPPAATYGTGGAPLLSWRVLLLPYLGEEELYKQFKLDEPWDSAHNKALLAKMPEVFRAPGLGDKDSYETFYQVFTGKGTPFEGRDGIRLDQITDNLEWTVLIVEAGTAVPWTKPADIVYDAGKPLPKLGGVFKDGFCAGLADGSAKFVPRDVADVEFRAWITPAAGDVANNF